MSVDSDTVKRIARLARIRVDDAEVTKFEGEINGILHWIEQLNEVDVQDVEPMTSVRPMVLRQREDQISDGGYPEDVTGNSPLSEDHFFLVPKVIE